MSAETKKSRFHQTIQFVAQLHHHQSLEGAGDLPPRLAFLRQWQSQRLAATHADLLAHPRYGPACRFFLSDIYAPRDFSQRDHDIEYLYTLMSRILPDFLLGLARNAIEMNRLTNALDQALLQVLVENLGMEDELTPEMYAEAYRQCNNYPERVRQIELVVQVGKQVELGARIPLVSLTLRLARTPAQRAGWSDLQDFLERGFAAFKHVGRAEVFLNTLHRREMEILERIYASHPHPFDIH